MTTTPVQHHFVVFARRTETGDIEWALDDGSVLTEPIYDPDTESWRRVRQDDLWDDAEMAEELVRRLNASDRL